MKNMVFMVFRQEANLYIGMRFIPIQNVHPSLLQEEAAGIPFQIIPKIIHTD